jgi:hypothetical protein
MFIFLMGNGTPGKIQEKQSLVNAGMSRNERGGNT